MMDDRFKMGLGGRCRDNGAMAGVGQDNGRRAANSGRDNGINDETIGMWMDDHASNVIYMLHNSWI